MLKKTIGFIRWLNILHSPEECNVDINGLKPIYHMHTL